jgi:REP element-mobilizing transposase RayT
VQVCPLALASIVLARRDVPLPRPVYPGAISFVTRNCTHDQFLLHPDEETVNAVIYCFVAAAQRHGIGVIALMHMSNHLHYQVHDPLGKLPDFTRDFHRNLAKCINVRLDRKESLFATEQGNVVELIARGDMLAKLVYILTNPVKDGLVATVEEWPGAQTWTALRDNLPLRATRPRYYFDDDGDMPEEVEMYLTIPSRLGDREVLVAELEKRIRRVETNVQAARRARNRGFLGRAGVLAQSHRGFPKRRRPPRDIRPTFACKDTELRLATIAKRQHFIEDYRAASKALRAASPIPFPYGTYWFVRFAGMPVVQSQILN